MKSRYEQPIPYGWYALEYCNVLAAGDVKPVHYFGRELVLFRTLEGQATLLDAYCPHLGAHLGHGGIAHETSISCPFHGWKFNSNGACVDVPYAKRIPPKVAADGALKSYPIIERNQMIWAWYHPENVKPLFDVVPVEELSSEQWTDLDTYDWHINSIIQEMGENAADIAHFVTVHQAAEMPEGVVTMKGAVRETIMDSRVNDVDENGVLTEGDDNIVDAKLVSTSMGPGQTIQKFTRMFDVVMLGTVTPIDSQTVELRFNFSMPKSSEGDNKLYAQGFIDEVVRQVGQDIPIWEHKTYRPNPVLCDGDGPIAKYRKWFNQFYA
jgi:nitrite reductase/ring-hydroxylating ferredoxin subunit